MRSRPAWLGSPEKPAPAADVFTRVVLGIRSLRTSHTSLDIAITAAIVATNADALKREVVDAIEDGVLHVALDLASCPRGDARGFGALVSLANLLRRKGGSLTVVAISDDLRAQFRRLGVGWLVPIRIPEVQPCHSPEARF